MTGVLFPLLRHEAVFFDLFERSARNVHAGAVALQALLDDYSGVAAETAVEYVEVDETADVPMEPLEGRALPTFGVTIDARFMTVGEHAPAGQTTTN
jgi:hypothetical protein